MALFAALGAGGRTFKSCRPDFRPLGPMLDGRCHAPGAVRPRASGSEHAWSRRSRRRRPRSGNRVAPISPVGPDARRALSCAGGGATARRGTVSAGSSSGESAAGGSGPSLAWSAGGERRGARQRSSGSPGPSSSGRPSPAPGCLTRGVRWPWCIASPGPGSAPMGSALRRCRHVEIGGRPMATARTGPGRSRRWATMGEGNAIMTWGTSFAGVPTPA
jgi:hypothetical protein